MTRPGSKGECGRQTGDGIFMTTGSQSPRRPGFLKKTFLAHLFSLHDKASIRNKTDQFKSDHIKRVPRLFFFFFLTLEIPTFFLKHTRSHTHTCHREPLLLTVKLNRSQTVFFFNFPTPFRSHTLLGLAYTNSLGWLGGGVNMTPCLPELTEAAVSVSTSEHCRMI